jgi:hypothetical protein
MLPGGLPSQSGSRPAEGLRADTLPDGRLELLAGYGHGISLLLAEQCGRAALAFQGYLP